MVRQRLRQCVFVQGDTAIAVERQPEIVQAGYSAPRIDPAPQQITYFSRQAVQRTGSGKWPKGTCLTIVDRFGVDVLEGVLKSFDEALDGVLDTARIGGNLERGTFRI